MMLARVVSDLLKISASVPCFQLVNGQLLISIKNIEKGAKTYARPPATA